ncbi:hypothetical protein P152DRAFT_491508 [Eremomyces bilateralis CBS 781.70]|uniref:Glycosyltransferase 2-like domain-containing protein n=1 Tax=Eremomyces bilateralis CBS 781.70 TaxID=1392243 RepID=A0A6G1FY01_9PEZI|nr:uncharacterized protein P152DRAFT_491508 [Eremomyces bilateralis CBS 781.70]KAF1810469.1 hypothetical protein P152DRAFT_491508 [Eremomyces bilateralis CBS 781.70]
MASKTDSIPPLHPFLEPPSDDMLSPGDIRRWDAFEKLSSLASPRLCLFLLYFAVRIQSIIVSASYDVSFQTVLYGIFLFIEMSFLLADIIYFLARSKSRPRPPLRLLGDDLPRVDIFLPCCNEAEDIILNTLRAAGGLDYPKDKFRIIVLDDGNSLSLKQAVEGLASMSALPMIRYVARGKVVEIHSKAANLNFGLNFVSRSPEGPAPYIASLDIDMIPEAAWLRSALAVLLEDPRLAMASAPQRFYNIPHSSIIAARYTLEQKVWGVMLDNLGCGICNGSGFVARRQAFDEMGGLNVEPLQDDALVPAFLLAAKGWKTAQLAEDMQFGEQVVTLADIAKQSKKWMMQILCAAAVFRHPAATSMPATKKIQAGFLILHQAVFRIPLMISVGLIPVLLASGLPVMPPSTVALALGFVFYLSQFVEGYFQYTASDEAVPIMEDKRLWVLPYEAAGVMRLLRGKLFGPRSLPRFQATGAQVRETPDPGQMNAFSKIKAFLWDCWGGIHIQYITIVSLSLYLAYHGTSGSLSKLALSTGAPPFALIWVHCVRDAFVPIVHALSAKPQPPLKHFLARDPTTHIAYPSQEAREVPRRSPYRALWSPVTFMLYYLCFIIFVFSHD